MKRYLFLIVFASFLASCSKGDRGQLVGAKGEKWHPTKPLGMTEVPGGSFIMGKSDEDIAGLENAPTKTVTVSSFYMDETEITNAEYRQFTNEVQDSVVRQALAEEAEFAGSGGGGQGGQGQGGGGNGKSIQDFAFKGSDAGNKNQNQGGAQNGNSNKSAFEQYSVHYDPNEQAINWDVDLIYDKNQWPDESYVRVMDEFYVSGDESVTGKMKFDKDKVVYSYRTIDETEAAKNDDNSSDYIEEHDVKVYPDTAVWVKDFNYSYNDPMLNEYFSHSAYDDYPVVGVNWKQAKAFCQWRTQHHNEYRSEKGLEDVSDYRLPTEPEWEYAARGGLEGATYPWGGPYSMNDRGCFLANFKPLRGDYAADQALYTVEADSYEPNGYNLYNMAGNVSEWVNSSYNADAYEFFSSMNPTVQDFENNRKVVRGGSWKDVSYYLEVSSRDYEYADSARSYIGFRTVQNYLSDDVDLNQPPQK